MLRNGTHNAKLEEYAQTISNALKKQPLQNDIICYRNISVDPFPEAVKGDIVPGKQFFSTSIKKAKTLRGEYKITIFARKGTAGHISKASVESQSNLSF